MIITSKNSRPPQPLVSAPQWIWTVAKALRGIAARKLRHIRPHGNFMLSGVFSSVSSSIIIIINHDSMMSIINHPQSWINDVCLHPLWINHQWMMNPQSSILYHFPLIAMVKMFAVSLVARWRTAAFSQFCLQIALPYKKGNRKLIVPWSSFNTHRTTDNARACLLSH